MNIFRPETKVKVDQLVTTGTPSSNSFLAGDGSYQEITIEPFDVVGGRLDYVDTTHLKWSFLNSNQARLFNPTSGQWELVKVTTEPQLLNTALDLNGTALAVDKIYDVFAEYSSSTAFTLKCSRWASYGAGTSSRVAAYASGTTYAIGDRVTYGGHDWVKQSSAAAGTTPVAGNDWVDNGTSVSGDFAGLYRHNGVLVSDSSTTGKSRRWLGIIYTYNNSGTVNFKDDVNYRYISNHYNKQTKTAVSFNTNSTWTGAGNAEREWYGGSGQIRGQFILCQSRDCSALIYAISRNDTAGTTNSHSLSLNSTSTPDVKVILHQAGASYNQVYAGSNQLSVPVGYNYITCLERAYSAGILTGSSDSGATGNATIAVEG